MMTISRNFFFLFTLLGLTVFSSCADKKNLTERVALNELSFHLENNPVFETVILEYGDVKFNSQKDANKLENYLLLEKYGYVEMELEKEKKKFLSRDSVYSYLIHLKDKSIPYVIKKNDKTFEVKSFYYELDQDQGALIEQTGKNRVKVTVTLLRKDTDFSMFDEKSKAANSTYIKKSYNFRFDEQSGWQVSK